MAPPTAAAAAPSHRGCIVNLDAALRFRRLPSGQLSAELKAGRSLLVSGSRPQVLRSLAG